MPTIKLTDQIGANIDVELKEGSAITKYVRSLARLQLPDLRFAGIEKITLDKLPVKSLQTGLSFEHPVEVGADGPELKISAGVSGGVRLYSSKDKQLFDPDVFGDTIPISSNQFYVGVGVTAALSAALAGKSGDLSFGFNAGSRVALTTYKLFESQEGGTFPRAVDALGEAFKGFVIPGDLEDLDNLTEGTVTTAEGSGSLKISGEVNLLSVVNPLAVVNLPEPLGELKINSGGTIKVGASFELSGAYQLRVQKVAKGKIRLGYYKKRGSEFNLSVTASSGVTVGVGKNDLLEQLLKAISKNPEVDKAALEQGGLSEAQIGDIKKVVEAGVARKLELSLGFELSDLRTSEAAFLFEIELGKLDDAGRRAIHDALDGNLSGLTKGEGELPRGVSLVRSIFTEVQKKSHALKINLLGIFNFISVSTLMLKGTVMFEPATGELVITDKATATRIAASTLNFAADGEKLRKVLAESVLITAVYRCSKLVAQPPELTMSHSYFELHTKTGRAAIKNNLDVLEALGLMTAAEKKKLMGNTADFGKTTLYAETGYDDALVNSLFFKDGEVRTQEDYERAGRNALKLLVQAGEDEGRRLPAIDNGLWKEMKVKGQANFKTIDKLKKLPAPTLGAITTDYSVIIWWAETMREMGERLDEIRQFFKDNPNADPENNTFKSLRKKLASKIKDVAGKTKREFGDPWGLVAMDQLSGSGADAKAQITGAVVSILRERNGG